MEGLTPLSPPKPLLLVLGQPLQVSGSGAFAAAGELYPYIRCRGNLRFL